MRCENCGTEFYSNYCPRCLAPAPRATEKDAVRCPRCGQFGTSPYCTNCGFPVNVPRPAPAMVPPPTYYYPYPVRRTDTKEFQSITSGAWIIYFISFFVAYVGYVALLWVGTSLVVPGILENRCAECDMALFIITPAPVAITGTFDGILLLIYYLIVVTVISICFFWLMIKEAPQAFLDFRSAFKKGTFALHSSSAVVTLSKMFALGVFFNVAYNFLVLILGGSDVVPADTEVGPIWYFLFVVAQAAVWEEIISRTLLIGIPLLIIALIRRDKEKKPSQYLIGGGFKIGIFEGIFLLFSAFMFGAAHTYQSGPIVFPPLFVGGLILGYLFLKKGLVASMTFHFIWNYSIALNYLAGVTGNYAILAIGVFFNLFVAFVGLVLALYYGIRMLKNLQKPIKTPTPVPRTAQAQQYQTVPQFHQQPVAAQPQYGYQCPNCGWLEARYSNGRYQCMRCGHIS